MRIGHGYDVHRLVEDRLLILGGVQIPFEKGLLGHSDADVLTHALMDAMLGAAGLGDIGRHFPDTDPKYKGADSLKLLAYVVELLKQKNFTLWNADITLIAQKPKVSPYLAEMQKKLANVIGCEMARINLKATTEEHLGFTGEGAGMACHAVCLLEENG
ncbi:MAG: 2-C-methyl-D-erythritol 2,4-cyclodiphosphate synthase [Clostridia bacterium]|nr:2-C-methyl-D-erythritol 2,4-cyclodiphosphate synthase [Clostridia bacterium]